MRDEQSKALLLAVWHLVMLQQLVGLLVLFQVAGMHLRAEAVEVW
jgi:hypothetical protein